MVLITEAGGSRFQEGQRVPRGALGEANAKLIDEGRVPARGEPANPIYLPAPHEVAIAFYAALTTEPPLKDIPWLHQSLWHSCTIIFWGFITSAVVGVPLGILCGSFDLFSKLVEPFVDFIRYMPAPAFAALCVAVLGFEDGPKIAIIWIGTFFQMVLVVANTTRQFDSALLEAAQTLGAGRKSLMMKVILPGILPNLYNDMRILIGWAWTYLIIAELVGHANGISYFINQQGRYFHFDNVFAGIIMIGIIGLVCDQVLAFLALFLFPWQPNADVGPLLRSIGRAAARVRQRFSTAAAMAPAVASATAEAAKQPVPRPCTAAPMKGARRGL
jgi:NitT/TauT family transport system permease protein